MTLTVDVAVVAYRHWELTQSCLAHLAVQTREHTVYLCDNGCDEGTAERVRKEFPHVRVLRFERNMPYPAACNGNVAAGTGDVVVTMNNDVDARPDFLERLVAPLEVDPGVGSVAPLLLRPGGETVDSWGFVADRTLAPFARWQGHQPTRVHIAAPVMIGVGGSAGAFRRVAWEQIGGMDETISAYYEDFELGLRLCAAGWAAVPVPDAVAVHVGSATFGHRSDLARHRGGFGRGYLLRRYGVLRSRAALRTLVTEAILVAADVAFSRDTIALRGRIAGWRAGGGRPSLPRPTAAQLEQRISFVDSLRMRWDVVRRQPVGKSQWSN
ncbi:MAG TPA: glycosyltransferase family 2 protein [Thermoleophilaceae bacterium]